jgi:FAD/FMN-containing dehydrogenase
MMPFPSDNGEIMNRRQFLKFSGNALWQASVYSTLFSAGKLSFADASELATPALQALTKGAQGPVLLPSDSEYLKHRIYSKRFHHIQATVILLCLNEDDVVLGLNWAKENQMKFCVRSGGHSYEGYSVCEGLVMDLSLMKAVTIDSVSKTAIVQTGTKLGQMYDAVSAEGYALVGGTCPDVGIGGHASGGGQGNLSRKLGLVIDNIVSLKIVTADGKLLRASATENPDLFWACRGGGGGNFGIVTEFQMKLHEIPSVSIVEIHCKDDAKESFLAWQKWIANCPDELSTVLEISARSGKFYDIEIHGQHLGSEEDLKSIVQPLMDAMPGATAKYSAMSFIKSIHHFAGPRPESEYFKASADFVEQDLNESAFDTLSALLLDTSCPGVTLEFIQYGGAIKRVRPDETAFPHRNAEFCVQYFASWDKPEQEADSIQFVKKLRKTMQPFVTGGCYVNYLDADITNFAEAYYQKNLPRLSQIKTAVDPKRVFTFAQAIPSQS